MKFHAIIVKANCNPHICFLIIFCPCVALSAVRFSIVATSSQSPVLLLSGQPQNHYVGFGVNEYFKFYPHGDEDLHITLTGKPAGQCAVLLLISLGFYNVSFIYSPSARSGDPDLFVSTINEKPRCMRVANTYYT